MNKSSLTLKKQQNITRMRKSRVRVCISSPKKSDLSMNNMNIINIHPPLPSKKILMFRITYCEPSITNRFSALAFFWNSFPLMFSGSFNHKKKPPCKQNKLTLDKRKTLMVDLLCHNNDEKKQTHLGLHERNRGVIFSKSATGCSDFVLKNYMMQ